MNTAHIRRPAAKLAAATALMLLVPLVAMQFTSEVSWGPGDFPAAAVLLFGAGMALPGDKPSLPARATAAGCRPGRGCGAGAGVGRTRRRHLQLTGRGSPVGDKFDFFVNAAAAPIGAWFIWTKIARPLGRWLEDAIPPGYWRDLLTKKRDGYY